jgi:glycosyltransferase involved in cell wall biosynthesis
MGGPGVQRSTRFVQYLNEFGYDPIVLTISEEDIVKMGSSIDHTLSKYIPESTEIVRVESAIPFKLSHFLHSIKLFRVFWFFLYPIFWERSALWPFKTYSKAAELIKKYNIELVYTSSGPFSSLILGQLLKKRLDIKWVADMRDPYTDAYAWSYPSKWHWYFSRYFEKKLLNSCDSLIVNTPEVKKLYLKRGIKNAQTITVITNGY